MDKEKQVKLNISPKVHIIKYIRLFDALREITKDEKNITIAEREILEKELLKKILRDAKKDKLTIGSELPDGRCIFFADKEDIHKFESKPYRTDITTENLGRVQFKYFSAKLKIIEKRYNRFDGKIKKAVNKDDKTIPKFSTPSFVQAESLKKIKTEKTIDGKHIYHKIYYDISINNFVIPKREWERYQENLEVNINSKQTFEEKEKTFLLGNPVVEHLEKASEEQGSDNMFIKHGSKWLLSYEKISTWIDDNKGLKYTHCLLDNQGKEFHVLELIDLINKMVSSKEAENSIETVDNEYIKDLKNRYNDLKDEHADDKIPKSDKRIAEIENEMEQIKKTLGAGTGQNGRPRKLADKAEKARKAVSKAVNTSLNRIKNEHSSLWKHLDSNLTIGTYCSYKPEKPIPWKL